MKANGVTIRENCFEFESEVAASQSVIFLLVRAHEPRTRGPRSSETREERLTLTKRKKDIAGSHRKQEKKDTILAG